MPAPAPVRAVRHWLLSTWLAVASAGLANCSGAHEPAQRSTEPARTLVEIKPTANVPALLGKSIDDLRRQLGPDQQLPTGLRDSQEYLTPYATDSATMFRLGGLQLVASYDTRTRRISDLLLLGRHEDSLLHRATLRVNASGYLVLPVFRVNKPGVLLGLRVIPTSQE